MIYYLIYLITDLEFVRLIIREFLLYLVGFRTANGMRNNIEFFQQGGGEFEYMIENNKDIPCEVAYSYLNHAHECVYR